ncbi:hypothetical protein Phum_PHUM287460 [Pediculus humanus corporis]|uniref:Uncharacterized protein n=1 Tax=Pediculus humanus subsp. corporis TaxID=121224 RepID=E0VLG4_PEDHC|nr:uncharacterized protein Phum_PHUM287460 [Pediculus humanus corporis]EEB14220.1 hypothetical protein Phum_PHUM287460 [Pediculus humanus corporis]
MNDIVYSLICPEMFNHVIKHLRYNFFSDEPLNKSLFLCKPGQPHEELEDFSLRILSQGISFMGVDKNTGEVSSGSSGSGSSSSGSSSSGSSVLYLFVIP